MSETIACSSQDFTSRAPCLSCLSTNQLWGLLLYTLAAQTDYEMPGDLGQLMSDSACLNCLTDKQLLEGVVGALAELTLENPDIKQIQSELACLNCATPTQLKSAVAFLLCRMQFMTSRILDSGIATLSGGSATVLSDHASSGNPILLSYQNVTGPIGTLISSTIVNGVSFVIESSNVGDANTVAWIIVA